jgi:hypothetical protein
MGTINCEEVKMDVNVSSPLAANITILQPYYNLWITAGIGVIGAFVGGFTTYLIQRLQIKNNRFEKRKQIYSELSGIVHPLDQLLFLHCRARVFSVFYRAEASELAKEEQEKTERYGIQLAEVEKELWRMIGLIQVSFDNDHALDQIISRIQSTLSKYGDIIENTPQDKSNIMMIEDWRDDVLNKKLPEYLHDELNPAMIDLLEYLKRRIQNDPNKP